MDCITSKTVKTRKPHRCWWCGEAIEVGSSVGLETGIDDGQWFRSYWHPECSAAFQRDKECNGDGVGFGEHSSRSGVYGPSRPAADSLAA
jgi:hypothetical protein